VAAQRAGLTEALGNSMKIRLALIPLLAICWTTACAPVKQEPVVIGVIGGGMFTSESGNSIRAEYLSDGNVTLFFSNGTTKTLHQAVAASGIRFTAGDAEWWEHQGRATYSVDGKQIFVGTTQK